MAPVTWSIGPGSSLPLRLLWYAGVSVWGGFVLLSVGFAAVVAIGGLAGGDPGPALLVGLLFLVGGPLSLLYLWPVLTAAEQRPAFLTPPAWMRARWLALGSVAVAGLVLTVPVAAIAFFPFGIASGIVIALLRSEGELDPDAGELTTNGRTVDLGDLAGVSRLDPGPLTLCWLRYPPGTGSSMAPRLVVLPGTVSDRVVAAIEASPRPPTTAAARTRSSRAVQAVLLVLGLGSLAVGGSLSLVESLPLAVALWGGALFGLFGVLFLWLAYAEA